MVVRGEAGRTRAPVEDVIPEVSAEEAARWDREWKRYFASEPARPHLIHFSRLKLTADIRGLAPDRVFATVLCLMPDGKPIGPLHVWMAGDALAGRNVVELGCGCGFLGKQLGLICSEYLGVDYSAFAVAIARGNSPASCRYLHLSQGPALRAMRGRFDTMVSRNFFIHQNYDRAKEALGLGAFLLQPGGRISADFYWPNPALEQGVVHPARAPLDPDHASCAYAFHAHEIEELARECGLRLDAMADNPAHQRRFALLTKP